MEHSQLGQVVHGLNTLRRYPEVFERGEVSAMQGVIFATGPAPEAMDEHEVASLATQGWTWSPQVQRWKISVATL